MNPALLSELQKAIDYVRKTFADRQIILDFSTDTIKHLDILLDSEFKNGKLKKPDGGFAKFQGLIMIGISGYIAETVIKNTLNTALDIDDNDKNWYINFKVKAANGWNIQPGQQLLKRILHGHDASLYAYVQSAIKHFNDPVANGGNMNIPDTTATVNRDKKPWWKLW